MYANVARVKKILTEKGPVEDGKVQQYSLMADNFINSNLINTSEPIVPIPNPDILTVDHAVALACAYFYKFESGDTITAKAAEDAYMIYFTNKYRRPKFVLSTGNN